MNISEQLFLKELEDKLWKAADKLRSSLDAANYKHVVLGLIFLKYVSDAFEERRNELEMLFLIGLINSLSDTSFEYHGQKPELHSKDILGHVYEYFLGQFALAEGKQGGQYYTPKSIVTLIVEMLEPYKGSVYDPAVDSGGFFVSSGKFIEEHAQEKHDNPAEQKKHISVCGQESNPSTWKLAAMNMAIRGIDFNFGKKHAEMTNTRTFAPIS